MVIVPSVNGQTGSIGAVPGIPRVPIVAKAVQYVRALRQTRGIPSIEGCDFFFNLAGLINMNVQPVSAILGKSRIGIHQGDKGSLIRRLV